MNIYAITLITNSAEITSFLIIALEISLIILLIATCIAIFSIRNSVKTIEEMYYNFNKAEFQKTINRQDEMTPKNQDAKSD